MQQYNKNNKKNRKIKTQQEKYIGLNFICKRNRSNLVCIYT